MGKGRPPRAVFEPQTRFAAWLWAALYEAGELTQPELARKSGVSQGYISGIIHNGRLPDDSKAAALSRALGHDVDWPLTFLALDRLEREMEDLPPAVQRHLKPVRDGIAAVDRKLSSRA